MGKLWLWLGPAAILFGASAIAQDADRGNVPQRETSLVVYGDDPCPEPSDPDEIVVCARRPEQERYRVPAPLRRGEQLRETSWGSRAAELEEAQRDTRPDGCSVVGTFGQGGCLQEMLRQWFAERRARGR